MKCFMYWEIKWSLHCRLIYLLLLMIYRGTKQSEVLEDPTKTNNPEEIDIDDEEDAEDDTVEIQG